MSGKLEVLDLCANLSLTRPTRGPRAVVKRLVVMLSWELAAGFERAPMALSDSVSRVGPAWAIGPGLRFRVRTASCRWSGAVRVLVGDAIGLSGFLHRLPARMVEVAGYPAGVKCAPWSWA